MRFGIRLLVLVGLFSVHFAGVRVAAQESDAPFIFYPGEGGIVIERADGTDRRILGEDMNLWPRRYLQWSSTSRWVAWDNIDHDVYGEISVDPITISAIRYDGEQQFSIDLDANYEQTNWDWSSAEDWLLITQSSYYEVGIRSNVMVIDVESNVVLLELDDFDGIPRWSADGHTLDHIRYTRETESNNPMQTEIVRTFQTISMDGEIQETSIMTPRLLAVSNDTYIYWDTAQESFFIDGPAYDTPTSITSPPNLNIQQLYWNIARDHALVYALEPVPESDVLYEQNFYHLSLEDHSIRFISTFRISPLDGDLNPATTSIYSANWNPTNDTVLIYAIDGYPSRIDRYSITVGRDGSSLGLYLLSISTASIDLITINPMLPTYFAEHPGSTFEWTAWTPDGSRFLFATEERELAWFDVQSHQVTPIDLPIFSDTYYLRIAAPTYGLNWSSDGQRAVLTWRHNSWLYDRATDTTSAEPISQHSLAFISPDGRYAVSLVACTPPQDHWRGPTSGKCLINVETGERMDLAVSGRFNSGGGGWAEWHPTEPWVILIEDRSERYSAQYYSITDTSGMFYRDLTDSFEGRSAVDWLPDNVPIDD